MGRVIRNQRKGRGSIFSECDRRKKKNLNEAKDIVFRNRKDDRQETTMEIQNC